MIGLLLLQAVNALKKCKDKVVLLVAKAEIAYTSSPTMGQIPPLSAGHFSLPNRYEVHESLMRLFIGGPYPASQKQTEIKFIFHPCLDKGLEHAKCCLTIVISNMSTQRVQYVTHHVAPCGLLTLIKNCF